MTNSTESNQSENQSNNQTAINDPISQTRTSSHSTSFPNLPSNSQAISVKFDRSNFLLWESQLVPILKSQRIFKYLSDSYEIPPSEIFDPITQKNVYNPDFEDWEVMDQTLLTWINSSLTDSIKAECVRKGNARDVWCYLCKTYATMNPARILQLKQDLSSITKGNNSVSEYILKIKELSDALASVLELVSDLELVSSTLRGLGPDYYLFYCSIITRSTLPSFSELYALLLHDETHRQQQTHINPSSDITNASAFYSSSSSQNGSREHQLGTMFSFSFLTLVFAQRERVLSNLGRFVVVIWVFVVLILSSSYTASLTSMLTVDRLYPAMTDDVQKLINDRVNVGCKKSSSFVCDMLKQMGFHETNLKEFKSFEDFDAAFSRGRKNSSDGIVAAFDEVPYLKLLLSRYCDKYTMIGPLYKISGFGFVFPRGSPLGLDVSREILKLREGGKMRRIEQAWFGNLKSCSDPNTTVSSNFSSLTLDSFWVLFLIAGLSLTCAVLIFTIDFLIKNREILISDDPAYASIQQRIMTLGRRFNERDLAFHMYRNDIQHRHN